MHFPLPNTSIRAVAFAATFSALIIPGAQADSAKGKEIAARYDQIDNGFGDHVATATMVLKNSGGQSSKRELTILTLERGGSKVGDKTISVFQSPKDVKGTAVLSHAKLTANDNQWIYLPAAKRVKRISSSNKSGPFVGSEFAYEDITGQELGKYGYNWLKTDNCGSATCDVVERTPLYKNSGYSKQQAWFNQGNGMIMRIDFFNRSGDLAKRLSFSKYKNVSGYLRPHLMRMENLRNGKSTDLIFNNYRFKSGLSASDFKSGSLKNLRW